MLLENEGAEGSYDRALEQTLYRGALYGAAAQAFREEPSNEGLAAIVQMAVSALAEGFPVGAEALVGQAAEERLMRTLAAYAPRLASDPRLGTSVRSEYAELFLGPRPALAPYYESLYVGYPKRLFTQVTRAVRAEYERAGLAVEKRNSVPDDHLAYELEFMARLCLLQAAALQQGNEEESSRLYLVQRGFMERHLGVWTQPFLQRIEAAPCADYYRAWTRFVNDFVLEDLCFLGVAQPGQREETEK